MLLCEPEYNEAGPLQQRYWPVCLRQQRPSSWSSSDRRHSESEPQYQSANLEDNNMGRSAARNSCFKTLPHCGLSSLSRRLNKKQSPIHQHTVQLTVMGALQHQLKRGLFIIAATLSSNFVQCILPVPKGRTLQVKSFLSAPFCLLIPFSHLAQVILASTYYALRLLLGSGFGFRANLRRKNIPAPWMNLSVCAMFEWDAEKRFMWSEWTLNVRQIHRVHSTMWVEVDKWLCR